ncbi:DEAD/DEAH box helicase family protein [Peptococcus simiae]|uniref:DEAD/DEAH box helicase family protein n=1 Tax=Peptococcus simiae TaxID=1643805 RepID=UPI00398156DD
MAVNIQSFKRVVPMIYAYTTPGIPYHEGWTKVGYTERQAVADRIKQQTQTAGIRWELAWQDNAIYKDGSGEAFTDHDFHAYLEKAAIPREPGTEWFQAEGPALRGLFYDFADRKPLAAKEKASYVLRAEQERAVARTQAYFEGGGQAFLWNAKPRFGKTLSAYDLVCRMGLEKVLVVTNRPSIANSWAEDFNKFIAWQADLVFVSDTEALADKPGVLTRKDYQARLLQADEAPGMVAFESLQGLKGSVYFGGEFDKLKWIHDLDFDLLIVDEAHEGVDTWRTDRAFEQIKRKYTLYLSGTPFKALAGDQFTDEQIYNWSYADEQAAKADWAGDNRNPYANLPQLEMFTYQLGPMVTDRLVQGAQLADEDEDRTGYAFDLNEFFATNAAGRFIHEDEVKKFLASLVTNEKYPYSTPALRAELSHTLWLLNRVASAKALAKLLKEDPVFADYEVVLAAGDGKLDDDEATEKAYDRVKKAIRDHDKTITLSVGQLTVGVTIPEWSGILMLCNLQSPASYMQAAFRVQNPCMMSRDGEKFRKERAYVFDFDPARTLIIFDEFANNLSPDTAGGKGTGEDRKANIRRLLNFFPVIGEDREGKMVALDAAEVLSIPRRLKSQEVVRRGFMSNFLFQNIGHIFGAPGVVREIVEKIDPAHEDLKKRDAGHLDHIDEVPVDERGEVSIPQERVIGKAGDIFGPKVYETLQEDLAEAVSQVSVQEKGAAYGLGQSMANLATAVKDQVKTKLVTPTAEAYQMTKKAENRLIKDTEKEIDRSFNRLQEDYKYQTKLAQTKYKQEQAAAETPEAMAAAEKSYRADLAEALKHVQAATEKVVEEIIQKKPAELVQKQEELVAEAEKKSVEDSVRAHLRGFSRTIPSFVMAYGDQDLTLQNFDDYTEDDVFQEVTGISEADFRFLRDGGSYIDPETGREETFAGQLFDETVFNDSIRAFLEKKAELANYFDEDLEEDIFDYIPPQKTNQIFTPRWVVAKMVDALEAENPGCFDDPTKTFADLYMKSGLYITEIVKRLFRSEGLKAAFPDEGDRIRHILEKQVYGMAPTRIIYLIATNYILGFDEGLKARTGNFVQADAAEAAKTGQLQALVDRYFG